MLIDNHVVQFDRDKNHRSKSVLMQCFICFIIISTVSTNEHQHRTKAATEKQHDLWCYRCDTMIDGDRCLNVTATNSTFMHAKCHKEQKKCQVRRISMSTSTDEITGKPKMWLLQRNCSETCEPGCIVIGERTKLHSCITCCDEQNFCNAGSGATGTINTFIATIIDKCLNLLPSTIFLTHYYRFNS